MDLVEFERIRVDVLKREIDNLTHEQMCRMWRFGTGKREFFDKTDPVSAYFEERLFKNFGGFTAEISKKIGF